MFKVNLDTTNGSASDQIQRAASTCYQPSIELAHKKCVNIPIREGLFNTGHHSTMQHSNATFSFNIEDVPVSLATFGLHYKHPFYATSQRSGRYCTSMFSENSEVNIADYIRRFLELHTSIPSDSALGKDIITWVKDGFMIFNDLLPEITENAKAAIATERPNYKGNIDLQASRMAQEQLRNIISTIVPTGMMYTINLSALISMYFVAWNSPMRAVVKQMIDEVSAKQPGLVEIFEKATILVNNHKTQRDLSLIHI